MIWVRNREPIELASKPYLDLLNPGTLADPYIDIRFVNATDNQTHRASLSRLHADGGQAELDEAIANVKG